MMPERKHLRRLDRHFVKVGPVFFITFCTHGRKRILANPAVAGLIRDALCDAAGLNGWAVGRFVVMPDHVHLLCWPTTDDAVGVSRFVGSLKQWLARRIASLGYARPVWQREFFDRLLRDGESFADKWAYVVENPVRAGLVERAADWPYQGEICDPW